MVLFHLGIFWKSLLWYASCPEIIPGLKKKKRQDQKNPTTKTKRETVNLTARTRQSKHKKYI